MTVAIQLPPKRNLCGTAEAAARYGCSQRHIRTMADRKEIWSKKVSERVLLVDADEIERLAQEKARLRKAGKLCGRRPVGQKSA